MDDDNNDDDNDDNIDDDQGQEMKKLNFSLAGLLSRCCLIILLQLEGC